MIAVQVRAEQVRALYRQTAPVLLANCVNAVIVSATLWGSASRSFLLGWVGAMFGMSAARALLFRRYRALAPPPAEADVWARRFLAGSAAAGVLWGGAAFVLLEDASPLSQLLITFVLGGMCAAAAGTLASYLPAFVAFVLPALAACCLRMGLFDDSTHQVMAGVIVVYGLGLFAVARGNHRALTEAFSLRFENAALVLQLSLAQRGLEETNRTLEQRVAERGEALRKQADALRDAQRMEAIGRLAGGVAHDFNNLLTVVLANVSELIQDRSLDDQARSTLREIREASSKGADLVQQLLMFSRRQRSTRQTLDLNRTVRTMDKLLGRLLDEQLTLRLLVPDEPLYVQVDPTQIEQVIINLLTNARDAMPSGGVVTVETRSLELAEAIDRLEPGTYAVLSVSDLGVGMDAETQRHMFEPFFTTKEVGKGTGLGLATVYGIVEQSGGQVHVSSEPGQGSCFSVYLRRVEPPTVERALDAGPPRQASGLRAIPSASRGITVLLVEDEPTVRLITERILKRAGHRVLSASSAEQALAISAAHPGTIELLVSDVVMAGMDGPALADALRALRAELRVLFISGYSRNHSIAEHAANGGSGFLAKPFTYEALIAKVTELLAAPGHATQAPAARA
jgi:signal transduction histidine kinase/ActR/RegA family two-component response regulator